MADLSKLVRSAWGITAWTAVSRLTGLLRDVTVAGFLGAGAASDAYVAAFRIPNTFRALLGEGGLPGAMIPMAKKVARERPGEEGRFAGRFLSLLFVVVSALVLLGIAFSPFVVTLFARGFAKTEGKLELAIRLTRLMFPYLLFISCASALEAFLNTRGRFQLSAATPAVWNLSVVLGAWLLTPAGVPATYALVAGVLFGGLLQMAMQVPAARREGLRFGGSPFADPDVRSTLLLLAPRIYALGIGQINVLVSTRSLAELGDAFVTYNYNAFRLTDFVLGGFVVSVTRAMLPSLSEQALEKGREDYLKTLAFGLRLTGFVTIPSTVGLLLAAGPIVDVIYRRGAFDAEDVKQTALALFFFALGLYAAAGVKILTQAFYALHDTRTPVIVGTFDLIAFAALAVTLSRGPLGHAGVALATSAGFWINFLLLWVLLRRKLGRVGAREVVASSVRLALAAALMAGWVLAIAGRLVPYQPSWALGARTAWLLALVGTAAGVFLLSAHALGAAEVREALGSLRKRKPA